jgi:hypothetical protein
VALASGGFALAGSADLPHIPGLPDQASDQATESVAKAPKSSEASSSSAAPEDQPTGTGDPETSESGRPGSPTPNLEGLCRAFQATDHAANGSSLDSAAFAALTTAATAAGAADVATYCVDLIGEPREIGKPSAKPTPTKPTDRPTGKPSVLPTPTSKPSPAGKPSPAPGKPTDKPSPTDKGGGKNP